MQVIVNADLIILQC